MHIITICPRCKNDFMYHTTDYHLIRQTTLIDEVGNNEIVDKVVCQNCDYKENLIDYPIQDEIWASRRWNEDKTDYIDLSDDVQVYKGGICRALETAVEVLENDHPEFKEEHTTGWDMIQTIKNFTNELK